MLEKLLRIILLFLDDMLLMSGMSLIIIAAFIIGLIYGLVVAGVMLIILAYLIGRKR
ncbi:hypothetical protein [Macrococcus capreoli]|uniref:hypothetical protein n=1 Tax=Macrococcus capreoli TaxID=2982690 RepID=UPI003EE79DD5